MGTNSSLLPKPEGVFDRIIQFAINNAIWVILLIMQRFVAN